jgi:uncharacterized membrane protein YwzB
MGKILSSDLSHLIPINYRYLSKFKQNKLLKNSYFNQKVVIFVLVRCKISVFIHNYSSFNAPAV